MRNLYWSHIKMMRECPQKYLWYKGHPDHDLGAGLGKRKPIPEEGRSSEHHQLMGSVLSTVVELMYNNQMYLNTKTLLEDLEEIALKEFEKLEKKQYILWTYLTRDEAINTVLSGVKNFLEIVKDNRLLGPYSESELRMTPPINKTFKVCGIADLVFKDKEGNTHILDGKNASTPMKYEDEDQLRWYALCFRLEYGYTPEKLGFFYFRYPSSNPPKDQDEKTWNGMVGVDISEKDIERLGREAIETNRAIDRGVFEANPIPKHCNMCQFQHMCEPRIEQRKRNAAKRKPKGEEKLYKGDKTFTLGKGKF